MLTHKQPDSHCQERSISCRVSFPTCVQVGQVGVLDVWMLFLQVIPELHGDVGAVVTLGAVVHLDAFMFARVENVFADVFSTV